MITLSSENYFSEIPFLVCKETFKGSEFSKKHKHDFVEMVYVFSGKGFHNIGENKVEVSQGDFFIINLNTPHSFCPCESSGTNSLQIFNCMFHMDFIKAFDSESVILNKSIQLFLSRSFTGEDPEIDVNIKLGLSRQVEVKKIFENMLFEFNQKQEGYESIIKYALSELLITVYRSYKETAGKSNSNEYHYNKEIVLEAIDYLHENYSDKFRVEDLSTHFYLSKSYFSALFKKVTGINVSDYIQRVRVEKACKLLTETNEKCSNIMQMVGYTDYRFFCKSFKKITGFTPMQYKARNTHQKSGKIITFYKEK